MVAARNAKMKEEKDAADKAKKAAQAGADPCSFRVPVADKRNPTRSLRESSDPHRPRRFRHCSFQVEEGGEGRQRVRRCGPRVGRRQLPLGGRRLRFQCADAPPATALCSAARRRLRFIEAESPRYVEAESPDACVTAMFSSAQCKSLRLGESCWLFVCCRERAPSCMGMRQRYVRSLSSETTFSGTGGGAAVL